LGIVLVAVLVVGVITQFGGNDPTGVVHAATATTVTTTGVLPTAAPAATTPPPTTNDGRVDFQENELKPGDILLMHWRPDLLDNLKSVFALAQEQGYKIASLENYLGPVP